MCTTILSSESGFCDSNDLNDQYWEEAQHGSEVVQPCPGESTIQGGMARRQCTTMGWEPPQLNECARGIASLHIHIIYSSLYTIFICILPLYSGPIL